MIINPPGSVEPNINATSSNNNLVLIGSGNFKFTGNFGDGANANAVGIDKGGSGGLDLTGIVDNNNLGRLQIDLGTVRVSNGSQVGRGTRADTLIPNGGFLEIRSDAGNTFSTLLTTGNNNSQLFMADRGIAGTGSLNQTITMGTIVINDNQANTANGRNGANIIVPTLQLGSAGANGFNFTWSGNGLFTTGALPYTGTGTSKVSNFVTTGDALVTGTFGETNGVTPVIGKTGSGMLTLLGSNISTSTFNYIIGNGTLSVASLTNATTATGRLDIGSGGTTGNLNYIGSGGGALYGGSGAGETDSKILNVAGTANNIIFANQFGTGASALTISNLTVTAATSSSLFLGGSNTNLNTISSAIPAGTALTIGKIGLGTWVLSGNNLYTGITAVYGGNLIIDASAATGTSTKLADAGAIVFNSNVNSTGAAASATAGTGGFTGDNTAGGTFTYKGSASAGGSQEVVGALTPAAGSGNVVIDTTSASGTNLTKAGAGILILSSTSGSNNYGGSTTVSGGVLQLGGTGGVIPDASALIVAAGAAFDLNGKAETLGSLAGDTTTTGGMITDSVTGTSATLTIGSDNTSTTFAGILTDTKAGVTSTGNLILAKTGTGLQTLTGASTYSGATTIGGTAGGLQVQNMSSSTTFATLGNTAITVASGVSFAATVASGAPTTVVNIGSTAVTLGGASVTLSSGGKLDMRDNALGTFNIIEGATFVGAGLTVASTANLFFDIGSVSAVAGGYAGADKIDVTKTAAITSGALITLNAVTGATGITTGIIPLITASGGFTGTGTNNFTLSSSTLTLSGAWGSKTYNVTLAGAQDTTTQTALSVSVVAPTSAYWSGALDGSWSTNNAGGVTNWRTDATSNVDTQATPDATTNVFFNTTTPVASFLTTSNLTTATSIASLTFTSAATGAVTIGDNGSAANTLTIGAGGITHSNGAGTSALNMSVILGAAQTWTNNSSNALSINGSTITGSGKNLTVAGSGDTTIAAAVQTGAGTVTKQDAGKLIFTGTNTYSGATTVAGGNLQVGSGGIGLAASSAVTVSGTGSTTTTVSGVSGSPKATPPVLSAVKLDAPTLSGTGSVGAVTVGSLSTFGVLRPGDSGGTSPGTLTINGALTVNSGSQIQFGITSSGNNAFTLDAGWDQSMSAASYLAIHAAAGAGSTPDAIYTQWNTVSGTYSSLSLAGQALNLGSSSGGTPMVLVQTAGAASLAEGDIFKLLDWASIASGTPGSIGTPSGNSAFNVASDLLLPDLGPTLSWDTSAFALYGVVVIVPEPGRMVLMLFGLAALFMRRRRTQTRSIG